jgi:hypothetical protein
MAVDGETGNPPGNGAPGPLGGPNGPYPAPQPPGTPAETGDTNPEDDGDDE